MVCWAAILIGTSAAQAQAVSRDLAERGSNADWRDADWPDADVAKLIEFTLSNIQRARCGKQPCTPAAPEEIANPPITVNEAREIMHRGWISAAAEICGLDWQSRNFLLMTAHWRHSLKKNPRQLALVALLHGIAQEQASQVLSKNPCTDENRRNVDAQLTFKP